MQNVLHVTFQQLADLIQYSKKTQKLDKQLSDASTLLKAHKQVLLARLIGLSIAELTQLLSLLARDKQLSKKKSDLNPHALNAEEIADVVVLIDWLKAHSMTLGQFWALIDTRCIGSPA